MKKKLLTVFVSGVVIMVATGCDSAPSLNQQQEFELKKLKMAQDHELKMKQQEAVAMGRAVGVTSHEGSWETYNQPVVPNPPEQPVHTTAAANQGVQVPDSTQPVDSGSSILGTVAAVGAGALAGYAVSGLLDNGHRSYSDNAGNTRYVDNNGREISRTEFENHRAKSPIQTKASDLNQKGQAAVKTGQQKTVQAVQTVKQKVAPKPAPRPAPRPVSRPK
ncbi:MAG: hypothetical protein ACRCUJ_00555 [Phocaeicola sp.]